MGGWALPAAELMLGVLPQKTTFGKQKPKKNKNKNKKEKENDVK